MLENSVKNTVWRIGTDDVNRVSEFEEIFLFTDFSIGLILRRKGIVIDVLTGEGVEPSVCRKVVDTFDVSLHDGKRRIEDILGFFTMLDGVRRLRVH